MNNKTVELDIDTIRHSTAHLMAQAIKRVFTGKEIQFGIGPVIENGFYYDIGIDHQITETDLKNIQEEMKKIIKEKLPIERKILSKQDAVNYFNETKQLYKVELINELPLDTEISIYTQGEFTDLCKGPHANSTGQIPMSFKLLNVAGAYWRGDEKRPMLQRVYATCFNTKDELQAHLYFLEQAKKLDHRKLGKELSLFLLDPVAPGSPFFMPKGAHIYNALVDYMRRIYKKFGYQEVITPQILESSLWKTSGHYDHYKENMFFTNCEEKEYAVKPMNCPCHMLMYKHFKYSYRDLPMRYADFGRIHRYEKSGTLAGLTRVRTFCQDDAHIFIQLDKIQSEISSLMEMFFTTYRHFGFNDIIVNLSTRPEKKSGDDATWDIAENALKGALEKSGYPYRIKEGDGAFYGPKIDVEVADAIKRYHQLGTIQLDFQLPARFDLKFTNSKGEEEQPVVIHRALLGSLERFIGIFIEHVGGAFPFWIAPEQAVIVPINDAHLDFCKTLQTKLTSLGLRITVDDRNESMGFKTRQIQKAKIPFMLVIGDKEIEGNSVSARKYGESESETLSIDALIQRFLTLDQEKVPKELR